MLSTLDFIDSGLNICILGPSDSGKSYLAKALGIAACNSCKVEYHHCESLLEALVALKAADYTKYPAASETGMQRSAADSGRLPAPYDYG